MKGRNLYKDIVITAMICLLFLFAKNQIKSWMREQKTYGFYLQTNVNLTSDIVKEFQKFFGICQFEAIESTTVLIYLDEFSMETEVIGLNLEKYPLQWKDVEQKMPLGNTAVLFLGTESFFSFSDQNGVAPTKSKIEEWMSQYQKLEVTIADQNGNKKKAKICGILKEPDNKVCMDKRQIQQLFADTICIKSGYMEVYGYQNTKDAQETLESSGFMIEPVNF